MEQDKRSADAWKCGGWDDAVESRRELTRAMSFRERMLWLERVTTFARRLEASPTVAGPSDVHVRAAEGGQAGYGSAGGEPAGESGR